MTELKFTMSAVGKLAPPATGKDTYRDAETPGLYLAVTANGVKTFSYVRRVGARVRRVTIGRYPGVTVELARKQALHLAAEIAQGKDPAEERRKARRQTTLGELFALYLDGHAKPHKRTWDEDQERFDRYLAPWKARALSQIRRADVAALHAKVGRKTTRTRAVKSKDGQKNKWTWQAEAGGPYSANRLLALICTLFNYAATLGYEGGNPTKGVKRFKEQSRDRFLHPDEIPAFFAALGDAQTPDLWRDFFTVALLTGARRANVLAMKWADLELERGLWKIPEGESKNKEPLLCVLPPQAVEILQCRHADNAAQETPSEFVFPSTNPTGHVTEPKSAWTRILERAGIKDLRLHDLRRTLGSWQAASGASLSIIGRSLGHKNVATTAVYARLDLDPVRASVNTAAAATIATANAIPRIIQPTLFIIDPQQVIAISSESTREIRTPQPSAAKHPPPPPKHTTPPDHLMMPVLLFCTLPLSTLRLSAPVPRQRPHRPPRQAVSLDRPKRPIDKALSKGLPCKPSGFTAHQALLSCVRSTVFSSLSPAN